MLRPPLRYLRFRNFRQFIGGGDDAGPKRELVDPNLELPEARRMKIQAIVVSGVTVDYTEDEDPRSYWDNFEEDWDSRMIFDEDGNFTGSFSCDAGLEEWIKTQDVNEEDAAETVAAKALELQRFKEFGVYQVVPAEQAYGKKRISTRWEVVKRPGMVKRARFVAREFESQEFLDDLFSPSSRHSTSRIIDYIALKRRLCTFISDVTNAFLHVDIDEEVYVDPPQEFLDQEIAEGRSLSIKWLLLKQLYGRRRAGQAWVNFMADNLEEAGCVRCEAALQFF